MATFITNQNQTPAIDITNSAPLPPAGVSQEAWNSFLNGVLRVLVNLDNDYAYTLIQQITGYANQQLPQETWQEISNVLSTETGVNFSSYVNNPTGLVNYYIRTFGSESTKVDWSKYIIPIAIIVVIVIIAVIFIK